MTKISKLLEIFIRSVNLELALQIIEQVDQDLQCLVHLFKRLFGLLKEVIYNALTEVSTIFIVIHLEDLCESAAIHETSLLQLCEL
jgi:hypothetical protein